MAEYPHKLGDWNLTELINTWETWVNDQFAPHDFPPPAFSVEEVSAMEITHAAWRQFANATPKKIKHDDPLLSLPEFSALVGACSVAIKVFQVRGRISEDAEIGNNVDQTSLSQS